MTTPRSKLEREVRRHAKALGFRFFETSPRSSAHLVMRLKHRGRVVAVEIPSSPKNFDGALQQAQRTLVKLSKKKGRRR